jgi:D-cysteine desulfhydrase family pyridoxal phosphate-dependent enzyme
MREINRIRFAHLPTPVEFLPRLSEYLGGVKIYIKRDDQTGLALGGNKTRKLEYLIADAQSKNAKMLITAGAAQSNHCRQTAAAAAKFGFECILVLTAEGIKTKMATEMHTTGEKPMDAKVHSTPNGNLLLDQLFGAQIVWAEPNQREVVLQDTFTRAEQQGKHPYLIPYGGSNPIGAMGYLTAMKELMEQIHSSAMPEYLNWIVFPSSSGGTQAGLTLGASLFGYQEKILGISVDEPEAVLKERVAKLATLSSKFAGTGYSFSPNEIFVDDHYLGKGYGVMGKQEQEAIQLFARYEGILLDPVYTGRAAAGLIDLVRNGFFSPEQVILFWHTGGTPALFAHRYQSDVLS